MRNKRRAINNATLLALLRDYSCINFLSLSTVPTKLIILQFNVAALMQFFASLMHAQKMLRSVQACYLTCMIHCRVVNKKGKK